MLIWWSHVSSFYFFVLFLSLSFFQYSFSHYCKLSCNTRKKEKYTHTRAHVIYIHFGWFPFECTSILMTYEFQFYVLYRLVLSHAFAYDLYSGCLVKNWLCFFFLLSFFSVDRFDVRLSMFNVQSPLTSSFFEYIIWCVCNSEWHSTHTYTQPHSQTVAKRERKLISHIHITFYNKQIECMIGWTFFSNVLAFCIVTFINVHSVYVSLLSILSSNAIRFVN